MQIDRHAEQQYAPCIISISLNMLKVQQTHSVQIDRHTYIHTAKTDGQTEGQTDIFLVHTGILVFVEDLEHGSGKSFVAVEGSMVSSNDDL